MNDPHLIFRFPAAECNELIIGTLDLYPPGYSWTATSGQRRYQRPEDCFIRGKGPIPPTSAVLAKNIPYHVSTQFLLISKRGIEGPFFPIIPGFLKLGDAAPFTYRDNFGIHFDANAPGSAGCIVLPAAWEFKNFCEIMKLLHSEGLKQLPLEVIYV